MQAGTDSLTKHISQLGEVIGSRKFTSSDARPDDLRSWATQLDSLAGRLRELADTLPIYGAERWDST